MGFKNFKIWGVFLVAIVIVAFMLFQQSNTNKRELDDQAIRNMELVKGNFEVAFQSITNQKVQKEKKRIYESECYDKEKKENIECKFTEYGHFDTVKVTGIDFISGYNNKSSWFTLNFSKDQSDTITLDELFSKIKKQKFFETVFLVNAQDSIVYPASFYGKKLVLFEKTDDDAKLPINKEEIIHNDEEYLLYYTPVIIDKFKFFLAGSIKKKSFETVGIRVNFSNLTILVFLLCLMLFSLPLFSFFGLTKGDKLNQFKVFTVGLSLVGIMVILGFGFAFFKTHHPVKGQEHQKMKLEIKQTIEETLAGKVQLLKNRDINSTKKREDGKKSDANEFIEIDRNGGVSKIYFNGEKENLNQVFRSLSHRFYYGYFLDSGRMKDTKRFNVDKEEKFYLGSHYSLESAEQESVISKYNYCSDQVEALTFFWKDRLTPYDDLREYLVFKQNGLIIHKSPRVKIAADSLFQLLSTQKWIEVEGIMHNNSHQNADQEWEIPLYLDGHAFTASLLKINNPIEFDQPLWMLYLQDEHLEHVFSSLITFETTFLLVIYLSILSLISFINKYLKPKSKYNQLDKFSYGYLHPKESKAENFKILIYYLVLYIFIILYYYHLPSIHFVAIFLILVLGTFHFKLLTYIILGPRWQNSNSEEKTEPEKNHQPSNRNKEISRFVTTMGIIILIFFLILLQFIHFVHFLLLFALVVGSVIYSFKIRSRLKTGDKKEDLSKSLQKEKVQKNKEAQQSGQQGTADNEISRPVLHSFHLLYTGFFVMWIFMIGFVPGYVIYSKVYQYESKNWESKKELSGFNENPEKFWAYYDETRRLVFGLLTNQSQISQVRDFIFLENHLVEPRKKLEVFYKSSIISPFMLIGENRMLSLGVALLFLSVLGTIVIIVYLLSNKIYFLDFQSDFSRCFQKNNLIITKKKFFICSVDSSNFPNWIKELINKGNVESTDCNTNPEFKWENQNDLPLLQNKKIWIIKNLHCLEDLDLFINRLPSFIDICKEKEIILVISSGISWKGLYLGLKNQNQRIKFSELFSDFIIDYALLSFDEPDQDSNNEQEAIVNIRSIKPYFFNIWTEMSFEEKKICYYYSLSGFYNFNNKSTISELLQKGILIPGINNEELPTLFHRHFRLFILNNVSDEEISKFKEDENRFGNASAIQVAVFSFILISVAMISYFDKNFLDQATTFVAGIAGALGGIYSLIRNSLPPTGKNKS